MRKGSILINVIIIMIMLNMLVLSILTMNKNLVNTRVISIKNKEDSIYENSKLNILDIKIIKNFEKSLEKFAIELEKDENSKDTRLTLIMIETMNSNLNPFIFEDIYIKLGNKTLKSDGYSVYYEIYYEISKKNKDIIYHIQMPKLSEEDINALKNKDIQKVFEKYKSAIIISKK